MVTSRTTSELLLHQLHVAKHRPRKVKLLNELARYSYRNAPSLAIEYATKARCVAQEIGDKHLEAQSLVEIAGSCHITSNYSAAQTHLNEALHIFRSKNDQKGIASASHKLAGLSLETGQYEQGKTYALDALKWRRMIQDPKGIIDSLIVLSGYEERTMNYSASLTNLYEARVLAKQLGYKGKEGIALSDIAMLFRRTGDLERADTLMRQALVEEKASDDLPSQASAILTLGQLALSSKDYTSSRKHILESFNLYATIGERKGLATSLIAMSNHYISLCQYNEALRFAEEAYLLSNNLEQHELRVQSSMVLSLVLIRKGQGLAALTLLYSILGLLRCFDMSRSRVQVYECLSEAYELLKDHENALKFYKLRTLANEEIQTKCWSVFIVDWEHLSTSETFLNEVPAAYEKRVKRLTFAELQVVRLLREGCNSKQIADDLNISKRTVDQHRLHIRQKLELKGGHDLRSFFAHFTK